MNGKKTVMTAGAAILAVSLGMSGAALAGGRHHGGYGYGHSSGHGYNHHREYRGYGRGHEYNRHRGYGQWYGRNYGYGGHTNIYYPDDHDDLLLGLLLGGFTGYALDHGYRR
jgi:hypothetical protein